MYTITIIVLEKERVNIDCSFLRIALEVSMQAIGGRIRHLREKMGVTITEVARATGVSKSNISCLKTIEANRLLTHSFA